MTQQHPIAPPPELVRAWNQEATGTHFEPYGYSEFIATRAAQWGADQELEACCQFLRSDLLSDGTVERLRAARRPKPPSLKEQALAAARRFYAKGHEDCTDEEVKDDFDVLRRALEQLDDSL